MMQSKGLWALSLWYFFVFLNFLSNTYAHAFIHTLTKRSQDRAAQAEQSVRACEKSPKAEEMLAEAQPTLPSPAQTGHLVGYQQLAWSRALK